MLSLPGLNEQDNDECEIVCIKRETTFRHCDVWYDMSVHWWFSSVETI
jgi:hypothetical protein